MPIGVPTKPASELAAPVAPKVTSELAAPVASEVASEVNIPLWSIIILVEATFKVEPKLR